MTTLCALVQDPVPEEADDAGPSTPEFYTPRSEDEFYSPRAGEGGGVGSTPAERRILFDDRRSNSGTFSTATDFLTPPCELG